MWLGRPWGCRTGSGPIRPVDVGPDGREDSVPRRVEVDPRQEECPRREDEFNEREEVR